MSALKLLALLALLALFALEPALAGNKFETISSGVSGSFRVKREYLQIFFVVFGTAMLISSVLCIVIPRSNAHYLNFSGWKQSAFISFLVSVGLYAAAVFI